MKKISKVMSVTLATLLLFGCATTEKSEKKSEPQMYIPTEETDSRDVIEKQFSENEKLIYDYVFSVLMQQHKTRNESSFENGSIKITKIPVSNIVIETTTSSCFDEKSGYEKSNSESKEFFEQKFGTKYSDAFDNYVENNKVRTNISNIIENDKRLISLKSVYEKMGEIEKDPDEYWNAFYKAAPNSCGRLSISNIGFNKEQSTAVIEITLRRSSWSRYTNYLIFGNSKSGNWEVIDVLTTIQG